MIVPMQRVRFLGALDRIEALLPVLQELEVVHLDDPKGDGELAPVRLSDRQRRTVRHLRSILRDCERVLEVTGGLEGRSNGETLALPRLAHLARRLRRRADRSTAERAALESEREQLARYREVLEAFDPLLDAWDSDTLHHQLLLLRKGADGEVERIETELDRLTDGVYELRRRDLPSGEIALLVLVPNARAETVETLWRRATLEEIAAPRALARAPGVAPLEAVRRRAETVDAELAGVRSELAAIAATHGATLRAGRARIHDLTATLEALPRIRRTRHAFVLEGWVPEPSLERVRRRIAETFGSSVVVEVLGREEWRGAETPVELANPPLFRPFEALVRPFPLPRYGTLDPTPFVAVFFPMFFGLILGDVGYGLVLALLGLVLHATAPGPGLRRDIGHIALACALFTVVFGVLYGELFGDLGRRWLGLEPVLFDRGEAVLPFLGLAIALGFVHLLLGLVVGAFAAWRGDRRVALGRGVAALMVLGSGAALLVALKVLPAVLFTPLVVGILLLFPVLLALEGLVAPIELLSTLGHVLSYARIMAIGTASVMLAVVANRMVGALGSVAIGVVFALLFHLVNFALGVFSPAIHALRLHYVEFFGTFYSPGGTRYAPLAHWHPETGGAQ